MAVGGVHPFAFKPLQLFPTPQQITATPSGISAPFDQHCLGSHGSEATGSLLSSIGIDQINPTQQGGFMQIRGDQISQRQQLLLDGFQRWGFQQHGSSTAHHHRINHPPDWPTAELLNSALNQFSIEQHAGFQCCNWQISAYSLQLSSQSGRRQRIHPLHPTGVLCCHAGDGTTTMHPKRHECAQISLKACSTPGITAGNGEGDRWLLMIWRQHCHGLRHSTGLRRLGKSS